MNKIDLLNSFDVLSVARRWDHANPLALDQAQRLTSTESVKVEVAVLCARAEVLRSREQVLELASYLGLVVMVPWVMAGLLLSVGMADVLTPFEPVLSALRWVPFLGLAYWLITLSFAGGPRDARKSIEQQLELLQPVGASPECETALSYLAAGAPSVLAWRDIALYDRKVLYAFDVAVMRALHKVWLGERPESEKTAAAEAAYRQLYGNTNSAPAVPVTHQ